MKRIKELIKKHLNNSLNKEEKQELDAWAAEREDRRLLLQQLANKNELFNELKKMYEIDKEAGWQNLMNKLSAKKSNHE